MYTRKYGTHILAGGRCRVLLLMAPFVHDRLIDRVAQGTVD